MVWCIIVKLILNLPDVAKPERIVEKYKPYLKGNMKVISERLEMKKGESISIRYQ